MADIRDHLDEHMDAAVAVGLRRRGIDLATTFEASLTQATDPEQLAFALTQGRVFVTRDRRILASVGQGIVHPGIVVARSGRATIGPTFLSLTHLHRTVTAEEMTGRIEYL